MGPSEDSAEFGFAATAALVPDTAIGRMLDQDEAATLIQSLRNGRPRHWCGG
jgi:hypothetical protein